MAQNLAWYTHQAAAVSDQKQKGGDPQPEDSHSSAFSILYDAVVVGDVLRGGKMTDMMGGSNAQKEIFLHTLAWFLSEERKTTNKMEEEDEKLKHDSVLTAQEQKQWEHFRGWFEASYVTPYGQTSPLYCKIFKKMEGGGSNGIF